MVENEFLLASLAIINKNWGDLFQGKIRQSALLIVDGVIVAKLDTRANAI